MRPSRIYRMTLFLSGTLVQGLPRGMRNLRQPLFRPTPRSRLHRFSYWIGSAVSALRLSSAKRDLTLFNGASPQSFL